MTTLLDHATEVLLLLFLIITFLQSGLDKLLDWKGNVSWLKEHFAKTPFKNSVALLVGIILVVELLAGIFSIAGIYQLLSADETVMAFYGGILSCVALLMLLFGQRIAKDYEGARTIVIYFIPAILLVFLLQ